MVTCRLRILFLWLLPSFAAGQGTQLPLTDDSWINGNAIDTPFGDQSSLFIHNFGPKEGLVRFDTSSIAGRNVTNATLKLFVSSVRSAGTLSVHPINLGWSEQSVTWATQPGFRGQVASAQLDPSDANARVEIPLTTLVSQWANGSVPNHGLQLVTASGIRAFLGSKEAGTGAILEVETEGSSPPVPPEPPDPPTPSVGPKVLDLTDPEACIIDEPGRYVVDRNWNLFEPGLCVNRSAVAACDGLIHISADNVILDLRGHMLRAQDPQGPDPSDAPAIIRVSGADVTVRDGFLQNLGLTICARDGSNTVIDAIVGGAVSTGPNSIIVDSRLGDRAGFCALAAGDSNRVERNAIFGSSGGAGLCVNSRSTVRFNRIGGGEGEPSTIIVDGDSNIIAANIIEGQFENRGNGNTIVNNVLTPETEFGTGGMRLGGTSNIVDSNIIGPVKGGIVFDVDGNFFGDNRIDAETPIDLRGTTQTDWGGNVEFTR